MVWYNKTVSDYIAAGSSSSRDFTPEVDFVTSAARCLASHSSLVLDHDELWTFYKPLFECMFGRRDAKENRQSVKYAFWTMVDHLDPENPLVELAVGMDHITAPKKVFIDRLTEKVLCRVDTTVSNRVDSAGHGILDSGAYLDPGLEMRCDNEVGMTIGVSRLGGQISKELTIFLNPSIFANAKWNAPFESFRQNDDDIGLEEGDKLAILDGGPTTTLHEVAHTVLVEYGIRDMAKIVDECLDPRDLPPNATAQNCRMAAAQSDRTRPIKAYGLYLCRQLARGRTPWKTLTNAESYCLFALLVFLYSHGWDLSSGVARRVDLDTMNKLEEAWGLVQGREDGKERRRDNEEQKGED